MKLPVATMQALLEMVRVRIGTAYPSEAEVIAQVIDGMNPTANALRQRRFKGKPVTLESVSSNASNNAEVTPEVTLPSVTRAVSESLPLSEASEILREEEKREEKIEIARARQAKPRRWTRVPADFAPSADAIALAATLGVNLEAELEKFRDHEFAKPKSDAAAAFRTWLRNAAQWGSAARPANGNARPVRGSLAPVSAVHDRGRVDVRAALEAMERPS